MNWHPGATITARYELDSGEARSRVLQPYDGQLSTPFTPSRRHLWTVVWEHKPGRVTTTIEVTFAGGVECVDPPATELSIATD